MTQQHPNLVLVYPDQMRGQAMGFLGEEPVLTPNLDRFAKESFVLTSAVANYPVCSPSRAMLMTGKYAHANRVISNCTSRSAPYGVELQEADRCWSDVLVEQGYDLGYIGKWHLDAPREPYIDCANNRGELKWNEWCPPHRRHGFDFWYAYGTYDDHTRPMYWSTDAGRDEYHYVEQWGPEHETDLAIEYITNTDGTYRDPEKPFALVVAMNPPHMPYELVPQRYVDLYRHEVEALCGRPNIPPAGTEWGDYYRAHIRHYYAMISGVDEQFGRILKALVEQGIEKDTIVVFTSDHGNCLGIHDLISKNNAYEESMRVPFLLRWPGHVAPRRDDLLLSVPDVYPTLLELMGLRAEIPRGVEGTSYAQLFLGKDVARPGSQLYLRMPHDNPAGGRRGVRTARYTYVVERSVGPSAQRTLYDRLEDPYQLRDVAGERPEVQRQLNGELGQWLEAMGDRWIPN
jgi:arylsulfatase A-like enzyme